MKSTEFNRKCRPQNIAYRDLFGYIPVPTDYSCTNDEFLDAITRAVAEKREIENYLQKRALHKDGVLDD